MFVRSIIIRREGDYGYSSNVSASKPLRAVIEVQGDHGKVELNLSEDLSRRVIEIIADEVAHAARATAEAMTADIFTVAALPAPKTPKTPEPLEIPF